LVFAVPLVILSTLHPNFYPEQFFEVIVSNYNAYTSLSSPENLIHYANLQPQAGSILLYAPKAVLSAVFRPFIWETQNIFQVLTGVENLMFLVLFVSSVPGWKKHISTSDRLLVFSIGIYVLLLAAFLALSTPNFGTLVRYRVAFIPFLLILIAAKNPLMNRLQSWIDGISKDNVVVKK
jgi:hypothetical protein